MITIKELDETYIDKIEEIDNLSNLSIKEILIDRTEEENIHIYGIFLNTENMIGYVMTESAIRCSSSKYWNNKSITISSIFIKNEYRGKGFGKYAIMYFLKSISDPIFVSLITEEYLEWFKHLGFLDFDESLVRPMIEEEKHEAC